MIDTTINLQMYHNKKKIIKVMFPSITIICILILIYAIPIALSHHNSFSLIVDILVTMIYLIVLYFVLQYNLKRTPLKITINDSGINVHYNLNIQKKIEWAEINNITYYKEFIRTIMKINLHSKDSILIPILPWNEIYLSDILKKYYPVRFGIEKHL